MTDYQYNNILSNINHYFIDQLLCFLIDKSYFYD